MSRSCHIKAYLAMFMCQNVILQMPSEKIVPFLSVVLYGRVYRLWYVVLQVQLLPYVSICTV